MGMVDMNSNNYLYLNNLLKEFNGLLDKLSIYKYRGNDLEISYNTDSFGCLEELKKN